MKKATLIGSIGATGLLLFMSACDESMPFEKGTGTIFPLVDFDPTVVTSRASRAGSEISDLTVQDLTLTLTNADGSVDESYPYSDFPTDKGFPIGDYTLTATYGSDSEEGFGKPAVSGSCSLTVTEGKAAKPTIEAKPSKAMVALRFDEGLTEYMTSCSARLHSAGGTYIDYPATETRAAYLKPGQVTVSVEFTKPNGKTGNLEVATINAEAQHRYTLTLSLGGDGYGVVEGITVKFDDLLEQEDVTVDISDDVLSTPAPVLTPMGFTPGETMTIVEGTVNADLKPQVQVTARGGIAKAVLTLANCPSLIEKGWPAEEIDLCSASEAQRAAMEALGLKAPGLIGVTDRMGLLDLSQVIANISPRNSALPAAEFTLAVTDKAGKTADPVTFSVKVERLELALAYNGVYEGEETVDLNVTYNGPSIADNLKFEYLNSRGVMAQTSIVNVTESRANYTVTVAVPADAKAPLTLRGYVGSTIESTIEINTAAILSAPANDVFAKSAIVTVSSDEYDPASKAIEIYGSTDGGQTYAKLAGTQQGADFHLTGLTPATTYTLRARIDGTDSRAATITTEAATQIPNSNFDEAWASETDNKTVRWVPSSPWSSMNPLTAGGSSSLTNSYSRPSGTVQTSDTPSGQGNAALIRTVGWEFTLNTGWGANKPKHITAGELYIGNYNNGANYGVDFASRPQAVKFNYKYSAYKSGETGLAEVKVMDTDGNEIASGSMILSPADSYSNQSITLNYSRGANKAATMQVTFRSVNGSVDSSNCRAPGTNETLKDYLVGASLYIDDVELVY